MYLESKHPTNTSPQTHGINKVKPMLLILIDLLFLLIPVTSISFFFLSDTKKADTVTATLNSNSSQSNYEKYEKNNNE